MYKIKNVNYVKFRLNLRKQIEAFSRVLRGNM